MNQYNYRRETIAEFGKLTSGTVSHASHQTGLLEHEPLIVCLDSLLRYAKAYQKRFESKLAEDYVLGPAWLKSACGVRELLNGDGAVAMERGITTDSKDNGAVEGLFWSCMEAAGFKEEDME